MNKESAYLRQFGFSYYNAGDAITVPNDFQLFKGLDNIRFVYSTKLPTMRYSVAVEVLDTAGTPVRSIGELANSVRVPKVQFGPYAKLYVLPDNESLPAFYGTLRRGGTYIIPDVTKPGMYTLEQHGSVGAS